MNLIYRQAAENIASEPVSIEPDGSVWADSDHRDIDEAAVQAEYERLIAERAAARAALLERLGISEDEAVLLREAGI
jgi:hypothetical protein